MNNVITTAPVRFFVRVNSFGWYVLDSKTGEAIPCVNHATAVQVRRTLQEAVNND